MSNDTNRQSGFGVIGIIAIVVVVLAIASIGFFVGNRHARTAPAAAATTPTPPTIAKPTPTPSAATPGATESATLTIKEWGITIPLPDSIKDAYYVVSTSSADPDGSPNTIWIGLPSLDGLCPAAKVNSGGKPLASIGRSVSGETDPVSGMTVKEQHPVGITIGNYYYGYGSWAKQSATCATPEKFKALDDAFATGLKTARTTQTAN
jgi:hypothetical protein